LLTHDQLKHELEEFSFIKWFDIDDKSNFFSVLVKFQVNYEENKDVFLIRNTVRIEFSKNENFDNIANLPRAYNHDRGVESYSHLNPNGSFCVATPEDLKDRLKKDGNVVKSFLTAIIGYLFQYEYWRKYGVQPVGERSHGDQGLAESRTEKIWENYLQPFDIDSIEVVRKLLLIPRLRKHMKKDSCPCGSRKLFGKCHYSTLQSMQRDKYTWNQAKIDIRQLNLLERKYNA
jgi:hypothetical protein